jgi:hypothetical protein
MLRSSGEVAEWSIVPDSKSGVLQGTEGSNPSLSAKHRARKRLYGRFFVVPTKEPTSLASAWDRFLWRRMAIGVCNHSTVTVDSFW